MSGDQQVFPNAMEKGLTKREHFAGLALQGMIAARYSDGHSELSRYAVQCADDLLAELAKEPT